MSAEPVRFGIAGVGRHGVRYARHLFRGDVPGARLTRVWRRDPEAGQAVAAEFGAEYCATFEHLVEDEAVDAVIMAVPSGLHARLAPKVGQANKPLLLEKPIARTTEEARSIIAAFDANQTPLTVAQTLRFDPLIEAGRKAAAELGTLVGFGFEQRIEPRRLPWEDDASVAGGGVLAQTAIHAVDALRFMTRPKSVQVVQATTAQVAYVANEDHGLLHLVLRDCPAAPDREILGDVRSSKIGASRHHRYSLFHDKGGVELDFIARTLVTTRGSDRTVEPIDAVATLPPLLQAFVSFVRGEGPNPITGDDALASLEVIEASYRAAGTAR